MKFSPFYVLSVYNDIEAVQKLCIMRVSALSYSTLSYTFDEEVHPTTVSENNSSSGMLII